MNEHQDALRQQLAAALDEVAQGADASRAAIDGDIEALHQMSQTNGRPPLIADVPFDEPPPYIPPPVAPSAHALIPDTPLVEPGAPSASLAFDDAPLWQS